MKKNGSPQIKEVPLGPLSAALVEPGAKAYRMEGLYIILGIADNKYHMSVSHDKRYPTWDEISYLRYQLIPNDRTMAMLLPPKEEYVNLHENCFHLWEVTGEI